MNKPCAFLLFLNLANFVVSFPTAPQEVLKSPEHVYADSAETVDIDKVLPSSLNGNNGNQLDEDYSEGFDESPNLHNESTNEEGPNQSAKVPIDSNGGSEYDDIDVGKNTLKSDDTNINRDDKRKLEHEAENPNPHLSTKSHHNKKGDNGLMAQYDDKDNDDVSKRNRLFVGKNSKSVLESSKNQKDSSHDMLSTSPLLSSMPDREGFPEGDDLTDSTMQEVSSLVGSMNEEENANAQHNGRIVNTAASVPSSSDADSVLQTTQTQSGILRQKSTRSTTKNNPMYTSEVLPKSSSRLNYPASFSTSFPLTSLYLHNSDMSAPRSELPTYPILHYTRPDTKSLKDENIYSISPTNSSSASMESKDAVGDSEDTTTGIDVSAEIFTSSAVQKDSKTNDTVSIKSTTTEGEGVVQGTTSNAVGEIDAAVTISTETDEVSLATTSQVVGDTVASATATTKTAGIAQETIKSTNSVISVYPSHSRVEQDLPTTTAAEISTSNKPIGPTGADETRIPTDATISTEFVLRLSEPHPNRKLVDSDKGREGGSTVPEESDFGQNTEYIVDTSAVTASPAAFDELASETPLSGDPDRPNSVIPYVKGVVKQVGAFKVLLILLALIGLSFVSIFCCCKLCRKKGYKMRQRRLKEFGQEKEFLLRDRSKGSKYSNDTVTLLDESSEDEF